MRRFTIGPDTFDDDAPELPAAMAFAYERKIRPICRCKEPGLPMYIAQVGDQLLIKRMPLTGGDHDPACESLRAPL